MRRKKHEGNKRYGWLLLFLVASWLVVGLEIFFVDPETIQNFLIPGGYLPMSLFLFLGSFFLFSILFLSSQKALRWSGLFVLFLYMRMWGLGSVLNGLLVLGILICVEVYLSWGKKEEKIDSIDEDIVL